ncbi:MAG: AAA family ATPase [Phenylobacterium sp.]|uniref:ATP-dependent nuclease n=1 Tax=Phenylobacterium sp. TaxID=1871053 RepID=UPI002724F191|nr:AAA family ATPase [Phenylobacterium sp.]MDO8410428.1 AAA family ATPase [Phenylobacterium sp.]
MAEQKKDTRWWATQYLRWGLIRLDGRSRFNLTNDQKGGDLLSRPGNILAHLFVDDDSRSAVRNVLHDAFSLHFVIDPTSLGTLRIRLSEDVPLDDEQSLNVDARNFHQKATYIKDASDGLQAFTGIVTAVHSGDFHTILVDEPEAFLHPPLARKLGKHLSSLVTERGGSLMASTHSPDFLMGCLQATKDVRVLRLEYGSGKSRGKMVDPIKLESFLRKPLMRSANVISSLFYDGVIVSESDNDRAFYAEVYYRLTEAGVDYPSILFVNAQNKQTIRDIVGPLREFGVPAAAIVDIDIIKDGGKDWTEWLKSARVPDALHLGYGQQRSAIKDVLIASGKDMKKDGGVDILSGQGRKAADAMFNVLDSYGIFAVRRGELEHWLPELNIPGKKTDWTVNMLDRMGSDPAAASYVTPNGQDVWSFVDKVTAWVKDPARLGM